MILAWLASNWRIVGLTLFAAVIAGWILTLRLERDRARESLAAARQEVAALEDRIRLQNAAVDALKVESDRKVKDASERLAEAQEGTHAARTEAERLKVAAKAASSQKPSSGPAPGCPPSGADRAVETIRGALP